jgi:hypothetical protein
MTEDTRQKEIRLVKELAKLKQTRALQDSKVTKQRDFSLGGIDPNTTHKATHGSADVPDAVLLPKKKTQRIARSPF